jgi:glycosyltransferase involved in cell wall biosynthesis
MGGSQSLIQFEPRPAPGINIVGLLEGELGIGEIGRKLVAAAERADIATSTITYRHTQSRQMHHFQPRGDSTAPYDTNLICVNADGLTHLRRDLGPDLFAGRYSIGVWFWELGRFPAVFRPSFDLVDEVWVASDFVRTAIARETSKPVLVVPIPLDAPAFASSDRVALDLPDRFLFLFSFDFFSIMERKNPLGLVEAFRRAFPSDEGPVLLIKSINGDRKKASLDRLLRAVSDRSDIIVRDGYLSPAEKDALTRSCDCYVSLHRSEGLGLTMAEAMSVGKPVIATGYSGNLTFMNEDNSYLVRHRLSVTPPGCDPYPPGIEWAEPDLDHAAQLMRDVYDRPEKAREVGERARRDLQERHTVDQAAAFIRNRLDKIPRHPGLLRDVRGPLERAAAIAAREPGASLLEHSGRTGLLRRLARRVLWPELEQQRRLDSAMIESLRALERITREELDRLERRDRRDD